MIATLLLTMVTGLRLFDHPPVGNPALMAFVGFASEAELLRELGLQKAKPPLRGDFGQQISLYGVAAPSAKRKNLRPSSLGSPNAMIETIPPPHQKKQSLPRQT